MACLRLLGQVSRLVERAPESQDQLVLPVAASLKILNGTVAAGPPLASKLVGGDAECVAAVAVMLGGPLDVGLLAHAALRVGPAGLL